MTSKNPMLARKIEESDMAEVTSWFTDRKWAFAPTGGTLPEDTGFVTFNNHELIACCWLYLTNSNIVLMEWIATNPKVKNIGTRLKGIKVLVDHVKNVMVKQNKTTLISFTSNERLAKYFKKRLGFDISRKKEDCCVWSVGGK